VRILALDSANPHGGVGGSLDSDQCLWLVRELERARAPLEQLTTHQATLEDVFVHLTGRGLRDG
jgi:hypothetical protein